MRLTALPMRLGRMDVAPWHGTAGVAVSQGYRAPAVIHTRSSLMGRRGLALCRSVMMALLGFAVLEGMPAAQGQAPAANPEQVTGDGVQTASLAKDAARTGFSPLRELTPANIGQIQLAFSFRTGHAGSATEAPLAAGGTLFLLTPFPPHALRARHHRAQHAGEMAANPAGRWRGGGTCLLWSGRGWTGPSR